VSGVEDLYARPDAESNDTLEFVDGRVFQRLFEPQYYPATVVGRVWSFSECPHRTEAVSKTIWTIWPSHDALTVWPTELSSKTGVNQALARSERSEKYVAVLFLTWKLR